MKRYKMTGKQPVKLQNMKNLGSRPQKNRLQDRVDRIQQDGYKPYEDGALSIDMDVNLKALEAAFKGCSDIQFRRFSMANGRLCSIVFFDGMTNKEMLNHDIIERLMAYQKPRETTTETCAGPPAWVKDEILAVSQYKEVTMLKDALKSILEAQCLLLVNGYATAYAVDVKAMETRSVSEAKIESVVRGPQEAFVEDIGVNLTLVRRRIKTHALKMEAFEIGSQGKTKVILAYIEGIIETGIVDEARKRLQKMDIDIALAVGELISFVEDDPLSPFPQSEITERPDSCAAALSEGRFAILIDGNPFVMIAPTTFSFLFTAAEDYYDRGYFTGFIRMLRYFAFFISLLGPSAYIAITTYHPEMIPTNLLISILNARADVPFPAFVEAVLMEVIFEIVRESGIRMPARISNALSIVGALVIGQISVQAGLISPMMVVVVSITGLASFMIPKLNTKRQASVLRFPFMLLAATMGIFGIITGILILLIHMAALRSFGVPYLSPFTPSDTQGLKDSIIMLPAKYLKKRPTYIQDNIRIWKNRAEQSDPEQNSGQAGD